MLQLAFWDWDWQGEAAVFILVIIGFFMASAAWSEWGPIPGLLIGFLFMGGFGWKVIGGLLTAGFAGIRYAFQPGMYRKSREFIAAWEQRYGEMERGAPESQPPRGLFQRFWAEHQAKGVSAGQFLDRLRTPDVSAFTPSILEGEAILAAERMTPNEGFYYSCVATDKALYTLSEATGEVKRLPYEWIDTLRVKRRREFFPHDGRLTGRMTSDLGFQRFEFDFGPAMGGIAEIAKEHVDALTVHERRVAFDEGGRGGTWRWRPLANGEYAWSINIDEEIPDDEALNTWMQTTTAALGREFGLFKPGEIPHGDG